MHEILRNLPDGALVLDLGCGSGSFESDGRLTVVRVDLDREDLPPGNSTQANAARLPFRSGAFDAVISNHSLEHFDDLSGAIEEIGRVVKPAGALYVALPDARTFSDRLYRWAARGGGHVNPFVSPADVVTSIERATCLKHIATRTLSASLSWLNRKNRRKRAPRRLWLIGGGTEASVRIITACARWCDRHLRTRFSVYGWAFYFGNIDEEIDCTTWTNVCIRCGAGHPADRLLPQRRWLMFRAYECPRCGTLNVFTPDDTQ